MNFNGFKTDINGNSTVIDLKMPPALERIFFAKFYGKSIYTEASYGEPENIWRSLSPLYNNAELVAPIQVHDVKIINASEEAPLPSRSEADGILIDKLCGNLLSSLRFADCTPIVIASSGESPWMLLLHSGFSGTLKNIVRNAMDVVDKRFHNPIRDKIWAWILPSIGVECYSRRRDDPSTLSALKIFEPDTVIERDDCCFFDIKKQIHHQLLDCGVCENNIYVYNVCTCCDKEHFYSYRAGDAKDRNFLLAGLANNCI
ncbi:MAG: polyphenol oxidase family protein [Synergistes sp.]|nr:polyphenol oxidase family protein [Synergistes sp.]